MLLLLVREVKTEQGKKNGADSAIMSRCYRKDGFQSFLATKVLHLLPTLLFFQFIESAYLIHRRSAHLLLCVTTDRNHLKVQFGE